jgi:hypothetical protein
MHAGLCGLNWIALIVDRACGAREVMDLVNLNVERECHVVSLELEIG